MPTEFKLMKCSVCGFNGNARVLKDGSLKMPRHKNLGIGVDQDHRIPWCDGSGDVKSKGETV